MRSCRDRDYRRLKVGEREGKILRHGTRWRDHTPFARCGRRSAIVDWPNQAERAITGRGEQRGNIQEKQSRSTWSGARAGPSRGNPTRAKGSARDGAKLYLHAERAKA